MPLSEGEGEKAMPIPEGQGLWRCTRNFKYVWLALPRYAGEGTVDLPLPCPRVLAKQEMGHRLRHGVGASVEGVWRAGLDSEMIPC